MAWVNVKGHRYYRRSKRVGGRVVTEYVGRGVLADLDARYDRELRDLERRERLALRAEGRTVAADFVPLFGLDDFTSELVAALNRSDALLVVVDESWLRPANQDFLKHSGGQAHSTDWVGEMDITIRWPLTTVGGSMGAKQPPHASA